MASAACLLSLMNADRWRCVQAACGATSSFCTMIGEQLVSWGKLKASGDNTMYPKVSRFAAPAAKGGMHRTWQCGSLSPWMCLTCRPDSMNIRRRCRDEFFSAEYCWVLLGCRWCMTWQAGR